MLRRTGRWIWAELRLPWVVTYVLSYILGMIVLAALGQEEALREVLACWLMGVVGLAATAWFLRGEESRPGPGLRPWLGAGLVVVLTVWQIIRPSVMSPAWLCEPLREVLANLFFQAIAPAAVLLAAGVSWKLLGLTRSMARRARRWGRLGWALVALLALPAVLRLVSLTPLREKPLGVIPLALLAAFAYALLSQAVPQEFLYRQILQPRLQALLRQNTAAIVLQAVLFGLSGAGHWIVRGQSWPLALLTALLQGSTLGLFYGLLRDRTGSLVLPVLLHAWVEMWGVLPLVLQWLVF